MVSAIAKIKFFDYVNGRKIPFFSRYRPICSFIPGDCTSGQIELLDRESFNIGDEGIVKITFVTKSSLGRNFCVGCLFTMSEGHYIMGFGEILEILDS
jgi:translation elongation factor EF-Tu-like GTPase